MDPYIDQKILRGPLNEVEDALRNCFDADKLTELYKRLKEDADRRLILIVTRRDRILSR